MDSKLQFLIETNRDKLTEMIENKEPYEKIVKQSQLLDKYVLLGFRAINQLESQNKLALYNLLLRYFEKYWIKLTFYSWNISFTECHYMFNNFI